MRITMEVNKVFAKVGDELTYTIQIENTDKDEVEEAKLMSSLPKELKLIGGTLQVEHAKVDGGLNECIHIGRVLPYQTKKITYQAVIQDVPSNSTLINIVDVSYKNTKGEKGSQASNTVLTLVNDPNIRYEVGGINLQSDQRRIDRKDEVIYQIELENKGNTIAENVKIKNLVPDYMEVITPQCEGNEILIGQLGIGSKRKITYKAKLMSIPSTFEIRHQVDVSYEFMLPDRTNVRKVCASNPHQIQIQTAYFREEGEALNYLVSKKQATLGEKLLYQMNLENKGNQTAQEVRLGHLIPEGGKIVADSIQVNSKKIEVNDYREVKIGAIRSGEMAKIAYEVEIEEASLVVSPMSNQVVVTYNYESGGDKVIESQWTQVATTEVMAALFEEKGGGVTIETDQEVATIGDKITYKIMLHNSGNQVAETIKVMFKPLEGARVCSPDWEQTEEGCYKTLEKELLPGDYYIEQVEFEIQALHQDAILRQSCCVTYSYQVGEESVSRQSGWSKEVVTSIYEANLSAEKGSVKSVDKQFAQLGEIITYTLTLVNQGNQVAQNVTWQEKLPAGVTLLAEQVKKNGEMVWDDIREKVVLGDIQPHGELVLTYQVSVSDLNESAVWAESQIGYSYEIGEERCKVKEVKFQSESTLIEMAQITNEQGGFEKTVNQTSVTLGEVIAYQVKLKNTGNRTAYEIKVQEVGNRENRVLTLEQLEPGEEQVLHYTIEVADLEKGEIVSSQSYLSYTYQVGEQWRCAEEVSPQLITNIRDAYIHPDTGGIIQSVDKMFAKVGEILKYTLLLENQGNAEATEVRVDLGEIPAGKWLHDQMLYVHSLKAGERLVLEYSLEVTQIPDQDEIVVRPNIRYAFQAEEGMWITRDYESNSCETKIQWAKLECMEGSRHFKVEEAAVGEEIGYEISWINKGNVALEQLIIAEQLSDKLQYVSGSLQVNGKPILEDSPCTFTYPKLEAGDVCQVNFKVKVIAYESTPAYLNEVIYYNYMCDPTQIKEIVSEQTTPYALRIVDAYVGTDTPGFLVEVDKEYADIGETLNYRFSVTNQGNVVAEEVLYQFTTQPELQIDTEFLEKGIWLDQLLVGETKEIRLAGKVVAIPEEEEIGIKGQLTYKFTKTSQQVVSRKVMNQSQKTKIRTAGPVNPGRFQVKQSQDVLSDQEEMFVLWKLINDGNQTMEAVKLMCQAEEVWALSCEQVWINEEHGTGDWLAGIEVGDILPDSYKEVKVKVKAQYIPQIEQVSWQGLVSYTYEVTPGQTKRHKEERTPSIEVVIRDAGLRQHDAVKLEVMQASWRLEEEIPYQLSIKNTGNTAAKKVQIQTQHSPILEKIAVNNQIECIEQLEVGEVKIIPLKFYAKALGEEAPWVQTELSYEVEKSDHTTQTFVTKTPKVGIAINSADLRGENIQKHISPGQLKLGDTARYTIGLKNTGNQAAKGVRIYQDTQAHLVIKNESILVNGQRHHERFEDNVLRIGEILPGEVAEIVFESEAVSLTQSYYEDCTRIYYRTEGYEEEMQEVIQQVKVESPALRLDVRPEKYTMLVGEEISYEAELSNEGNTAAHQIIIENLLPKEMKFVPKTLQIRGEKMTNIHELETLHLATLEAGEIVFYKWKACVVEKGESQGTSLAPCVTYRFGKAEETEQTQQGEAYTLLIQEAGLDIQVKTSQGTDKLKEGESINLFVQLANKGTVAIEQIKLEGKLAPGVKMLPGSFQVGEKNIGTINLQEGVNLGGLNVGEPLSLNYKVKIEEYYRSTLTNTLWVTYYFKTEAEEALRKKQVGPINYAMRVISPSIMQMMYENRVTLPYQMKDINQVSEVEVLAELISAKAIEGTGRRVAAKGVIRYTIHYMGETNEQQVLRGERFFLKEITLLRDVEIGEKLEMNVQVENASYGIVNPREMMLWAELSITEG